VDDRIFFTVCAFSSDYGSRRGHLYIVLLEGGWPFTAKELEDGFLGPFDLILQGESKQAGKGWECVGCELGDVDITEEI
jgi:hypothetical protein